MAGIKVDQTMFDVRLGEAAIAIRTAFSKIQSIQMWLADHPAVSGVDPLISEFGYNENEAYLIRLVFEQLNSMRQSNSQTLALTHKLTGLE